VAKVFIWPETKDQFLKSDAKEILKNFGTYGHNSLIKIMDSDKKYTMLDFLNLLSQQGEIKGFNLKSEEGFKSLLSEYGIQYYSNKMYLGNKKYEIQRVVKVS